MDVPYACVKLILRTYLALFSQGVHVSRERPLPPGPKIIAANHPNVTDSFYLPFIFPEKLYLLIQGNLLTIPVFGWLLSWAGQIPVPANDKKRALDCACKYLSQGRTVVIYPEGRLNPGNVVMKVGTGAVRMSLDSGAPIIPLGFYVPDCNTRNIRYHSGAELHQGRWQTSGCCYIRIGSPWLPSREIQTVASLNDFHELTARLMEKVHALSSHAFKESLQNASPSFPQSMLRG